MFTKFTNEIYLRNAHARIIITSSQNRVLEYTQEDIFQ